MIRGGLMNDDALRALPRDAPNFHQRQASHLRALAARATITTVRGRLLEKAEDHERLARAETGAKAI
jgi:hypothetical protein